MLCENCGKKEANVMYSENINGVKRELNICEECSRKLGIGNMDFAIPINLNNLLGDFFQELTTPETLPFLENNTIKNCPTCGVSFEEILNTGRFGCGSCYDTFEERINPLIKKIQGDNKHIGRVGKIQENKSVKYKIEKEERNKEKNEEENNSNKIEKLQRELKRCIKEEKYEKAAILRDEIKKLEQ